MRRRTLLPTCVNNRSEHRRNANISCVAWQCLFYTISDVVSSPRLNYMISWARSHCMADCSTCFKTICDDMFSRNTRQACTIWTMCDEICVVVQCVVRSVCYTNTMSCVCGAGRDAMIRPVWRATRNISMWHVACNASSVCCLSWNVLSCAF